MTNVIVKQAGTILTITVDLAQRHGPSKSGKTETVASTNGNVALGNGVMLGLNVYAKPGILTQ